MNYALVFRPEVREEVDEAYSWYESQRSGLGDELLDCIDEMLDFSQSQRLNRVANANITN